MLKLSTLVLVGWCIAVPAQAGLFADDDARKQIHLLEARILKLEDSLSQQAKSIGQQTKSMLDLQGQIDALNSDIRKLRGQNEELAHGLQDAEKRSKDFYIDLDSRLRHFETAEEAAKEAAEKAAQDFASAKAGAPAASISGDSSELAIENRALESAYALYKGGSNANAINAFQDFLNKYPDSVQVSNAPL